MDNKKPWGYTWVTQTMCVWEGKLEVLAIVPVADSGKFGNLIVRDGRDDSGRIFYAVRFDSYGRTYLNLSFPVPLENGLYVEVLTDTLGIFIQWRPISEVKEIESES